MPSPFYESIRHDSFFSSYFFSQSLQKPCYCMSIDCPVTDAADEVARHHWEESAIQIYQYFRDVALRYSWSSHRECGIFFNDYHNIFRQFHFSSNSGCSCTSKIRVLTGHIWWYDHRIAQQWWRHPNCRSIANISTYLKYQNSESGTWVNLSRDSPCKCSFVDLIV